ncbi:MAG: sigma-70 family RNA polymerase sigma factor [Flavobacterium sp.]|nr:MAG: sigma-70 family RNA polymerase sigma factor [Flavobacterium sp.]
MQATNQTSPEFLNLIEANKRIIFKICNSYCRNADDREDLAQEIIYQLWKSWNSFNPEYKLSTWMYRIALNVAISFYRKEKKSASTVSLGDHVIEIADVNLDEGLERNLSALQQFINELNINRAVRVTVKYLRIQLVFGSERLIFSCHLAVELAQ